jgi:hypothetical protein
MLNLKFNLSPTPNSFLIRNFAHPFPKDVVLKGSSVLATLNRVLVPLSQQKVSWLNFQYLTKSSNCPRMLCKKLKGII